ncbi:glycosyltransferase family 2 protein [Stratiformator vulcanicus]|uniref:N-glycosyltransferase n=1 Tax=Stratiformator vulcanicus TaxID=2527980 RepID=A0A517R413_9PLAN|nr:glycosyltransferase family 2 protein [Stratiformator vulcanicus]QDT38632.1 N-glycosyltransferase [Stratiformator vulcanicus]
MSIIILNTIAILASLPWVFAAFVFCGESLAALLFGRDLKRGIRERRQRDEAASLPSLAVLIPAHNEEACIERTARHVIDRLAGNGRVVVIADNCEDDTAALAKNAGAEVIERSDAKLRGKGYALEFGFKHLSADPPDVVFVLDADCRVGRFTFIDAPRLADETGRPVQSLNLCRSGETSASGAVSELGIRFKNLIRPLGLNAMGLPCHLMGTGMALPWSAVRKIPSLGGELAEDMKLGVDLALAGLPTLFCPTARVASGLPAGGEAFRSQRTRWEQGHLSTAKLFPALVVAGLLRRSLSLVALGLDLTIPPLSLFVLGGAALFALNLLISVLSGAWLGTAVLAAAGVCFAFTILCGWAAYCRRTVPLKTILGIPWYIVRKLPIYAGYFLGRGQTSWVRTARSGSPSRLSTKASP